MTNSHPLVSVIIPTYNREIYIGRAIKSAQSQLYKNIEIIVVDDGSTDNTKEVVKLFGDVQYYYKENGRQASARNAGLKIAKGEYICTLDSDDFWHPNFLSECMEQMFKYDYNFVFANSLKDKGNNTEISSLGELNNTPLLKKYFQDEPYINQNWVHLNHEEIKSIYLKTCPAPSSALVFKKSTMIDNWEEKIKVADDWEYVLRNLLSNRCDTAFCKTPLWTKHIIGDNVYESLNNNQEVKSIIVHDYRIIIKNNIKYLSKKEKHELNQHRVNVCFLSVYRNLVNKNLKESITFLLLSFRCSFFKTIIKIFRLNYLTI